jgi:hypothetical protein
MLGNYQRYEVTVKFAFDSEVFPDDPDDVFQLADLEKKTVEDVVRSAFDEVEIESLTVEPIITTLA